MITRNTAVNLKAIPQAYYSFVKWNNNHSENPITLTVNDIINSNNKIKAIFETTWPKDELWYTSTTGRIITAHDSYFDANIVSNTYENGKGIVKFDKPVTEIYSCYTYNTELQTVVIPRSVKILNQFAFYQCTNLTEIILPPNLTHIKNFFGYTKITNIEIPDSVIELEDFSFSKCKYLTNIKLPNNITKIPASLLQHSDKIESVIIPNSVTEIGIQAFHECTQLSNININDNITKIGTLAFAGTNIKTFNISKNLIDIGTRAFSYNTTSIIVSDNNPVYDSRENCNAVIKTSTNTLFIGCINTQIPSTVTIIGDSAFSWNTKLQSINIPSNIISIGSNAFNHCTALTSVNIAECVTSIGRYAFSECTNLSNITIPESVTSIGYRAFYKVPHITYHGTATGAPWGANSMN